MKFLQSIWHKKWEMCLAQSEKSKELPWIPCTDASNGRTHSATILTRHSDDKTTSFIHSEARMLDLITLSIALYEYRREKAPNTSAKD